MYAPPVRLLQVQAMSLTFAGAPLVLQHKPDYLARKKKQAKEKGGKSQVSLLVG
jgi:hypothetical protein